MPRYIKVEDAVEVADYECGEFRGMFARIKERLEAIPTTDAVEVVRCEDCKHYWKNHIEIDDDTVAVCLASPKDDAFCSEGERREDGELH